MITTARHLEGEYLLRAVNQQESVNHARVLADFDLLCDKNDMKSPITEAYGYPGSSMIEG